MFERYGSVDDERKSASAVVLGIASSDLLRMPMALVTIAWRFPSGFMIGYRMRWVMDSKNESGGSAVLSLLRRCWRAVYWGWAW